MGRSSRRAAVFAGLGALLCAFAGCEALIGLNDFTVRDCPPDVCEAGVPESGPDSDAEGGDALDSTADVEADTRDGGSDGDASDAPDLGSGDVAADVAPDVPPPTVTEIWTQWPMPNPNAPIAPDSAVLLPNPMAYAPGQTVFDQVTHLTWEASGVQVANYAEAEWHCLGLPHAGFSPWRVPTRIELVSLIDWTHVPTFDLDAFAYSVDADTGQATGVYWTSSLAVLSTGGLLPADASVASWPWHWTVSFATGAVVQETTAGFVRCVRGGA
jgi:hypothetical protein